jgi:hypothetical protein
MARKKTETKAAVKSTRKVSSRTGAAAKSVKKGVAEVAPKEVAPKEAAPKKVATAKAKPAATATRATKAKAAPKAVAAPVDEFPASDAGSDAPLTGAALLKKVKELGNLSKEEKAKVCGYSATTKSGNERVNLMKFYNALIEAEGINLDGKKGDGVGRGGRSASYRITVQSNGNLLIGAAYTKQMDLKSGDEFMITLGRKHIKLTQVDSEAE